MTEKLLVCVSVAAAVSVFAAPVHRRGPRTVTGSWIVGAVLVVLATASRVLPIHLVVIGAAVSLIIAREYRRRRERLRITAHRDAAIDACAGLVADLRSGSSASQALSAAASDWSELRAAADAAVLGADVPAALRRLAGRRGSESLRWVASAWVVAHRSGAGLASSVDRAVVAMIDERDRARALETELASARATARLLAMLPLGVLVMGSGVGGDPIGFLLGSTPGTFCLSSGLALAWAGTVWIERIADGIAAL
ncbi:MAG: type II secretion system F family protein [Marmoricola sp.]